MLLPQIRSCEGSIREDLACESLRLELNSTAHKGLRPEPSAKNNNYTLLVFLLLFITSCANPIAPTGGPKDETPPEINKEKSTPDFQTNFKPESIELTFNEWIKLQNPNEQVIISPPFDGYEVRLKGKTVVLDFGDKDTLRNDVTYVVQYGESVKDLTESNPAEDLRFVFSTGAQIDSLEVTGRVLDAYTMEPVPKALVLLYENLADSVFRTERPFYFGKTNEDGLFRISNMRQGDFKVCALLDGDGNYKFSQASEKIAFLTEPITVAQDSSLNLTLQLFQEQLPMQLLDVDSTSNGLVKLVINEIDPLLLKTKGDIPFLKSFEKDTLFIWHQSPEDWTLYLSSDTTFYDTLNIPASDSGKSFDKMDFYRIDGQNSNPYPGKDYVMGLNMPIISVDTSKITMLADSSLAKLPFEWRIDSLEPRRLFINHSFKENTKYKLTSLPGAFTNLWGKANVDTLTIDWRSNERKKFGNLRIQFTAQDSSEIYFIKLTQEGKESVKTFRLSGSEYYEENIQGLPPAEYQLEIIFDENGNGRWDPGHFNLQQKPEKVLIRPLEKLRANWDLEVEVDLDYNSIE